MMIFGTYWTMYTAIRACLLVLIGICVVLYLFGCSMAPRYSLDADHEKTHANEILGMTRGTAP